MHKFLKSNAGGDMAGRLRDFFSSGEYKTYQHKYLDDTEYAPDRLFVDFDQTGYLENPDFTEDTIGEGYVEFANLIADLEGDPQGSDCYAHLGIHLQSTKVYLLEPSDDPELISETLDDLLKLLKS